MEEILLENMDMEIYSFINQWNGTAIGEHIRHLRKNTGDRNFEDIRKIYNEVMKYETMGHHVPSN